MTPWVLLIVMISGTFTTDARFHSINMLNKDACTNAAKEAAKSSYSHLGFMCISTETGETLKFYGNSK